MAFVRTYRYVNSEISIPVLVSSRFIVELEANTGANKDTHPTRLLVATPGGGMEYRYSKENFEALYNCANPVSMENHDG